MILAARQQLRIRSKKSLTAWFSHLFFFKLITCFFIVTLALLRFSSVTHRYLLLCSFCLRAGSVWFCFLCSFLSVLIFAAAAHEAETDVERFVAAWKRVVHSLCLSLRSALICLFLICFLHFKEVTGHFQVLVPIKVNAKEKFSFINQSKLSFNNTEDTLPFFSTSHLLLYYSAGTIFFFTFIFSS